MKTELRNKMNNMAILGMVSELTKSAIYRLDGKGLNLHTGRDTANDDVLNQLILSRINYHIRQKKPR